MNAFRDVTCLPFLSLISMFTIAALTLPGCQQKKSDEGLAKPAVTLENLRTAHQKSLSRQRLYTLCASKAEQERLKNVARLFRAVARSEEIHAALHAELLQKNTIEPAQPLRDSIAIGTVLQTLKMGMSNEQIESESMYPNLIRTAEVEKYPEAADQFRKVMSADQRHGELFKQAYDELGKIPKVPYFVCPGCGYVATSDKTEECPVCRTPKLKFEAL